MFKKCYLKKTPMIQKNKKFTFQKILTSNMNKKNDKK